MRPNRVREIARKGGAAMNGWCAIPAPYAAELLGHAGYDCVTVDMQHGLIGFETAAAMLQAISATPAQPLLRVRSNDPGLVMQALDAGAYGVICPLVNSAEEARRFSEACRYGPRGGRSFGPARGMLYGGPDYFERANDEVLALAMIETRGGVAEIDAILALPEIDGVFIGPNDLCIEMGERPSSEPEAGTRAATAIAHVLARSRAAGKIAGIFCSDGPAAGRRAKEGFQLVNPGYDVGFLAGGARANLAAARSV
ncbi:HpcH/HpaI aldolase family protein [Roseomonas gilardii]|uniref:HpcH/HpaI aldolase family protein n=1 Tax=Roseomonas gilardii TaxID=257708 RepID=UPI0004800D8A|nr:aldolase/citrate lyase family protein [Roseomonas gilardii]SUE62797.1 4-hydroxy-2-oxo-heptane-1,7-dioate aldolase [Roseomonas gilardii subsp. rosea]